MKQFLVLLLLLLIPATVQSQTITTDVCPGAGCQDINVGGRGSIGIQITGTWSGTITFRASIDRSTFTDLEVTPSNSGTAVTTTTANGVWSAPVAGYNDVRVVFTTYGSGTANVFFRTTNEARKGGGGAALPGDNVTGTGTDDEIAVFNAANVVEGDPNFIWDATTLTVTGNALIDNSGNDTQPLTIQTNAAVTNTDFTNSGTLFLDAAGAELFRVWASHPDTGGAYTHAAKNTFLGFEAGDSITSAAAPNGFDWVENVGIGHRVLASIGATDWEYYNVAVGAYAMENTTGGWQNIAVGAFAHQGGADVYDNTAIGGFVLWQNVTSTTNTGVGNASLFWQTGGDGLNTCLGAYCGYGGTAATRIITDDTITLVGYQASKNNAAVLTNSSGFGASATITKSNQVVLGDSNVVELSYNGDLYRGTTPIIFDNAPTISAGFGAGASITAHNGPLAFRLDVGTTPGSTGTIGLPTAPAGWNCHMTNITSREANDGDETTMLSSTTTTVVVENQSQSNGNATNWTNNDVLSVTCFPF